MFYSTSSPAFFSLLCISHFSAPAARTVATHNPLLQEGGGECCSEAVDASWGTVMELQRAGERAEEEAAGAAMEALLRRWRRDTEALSAAN